MEPIPRNMLAVADSKSVNARSESDIADEMIGDKKFFDSIPEYEEGYQPTEEDIKTFEKVLKYAANCKYMGFSEQDAILVSKYSTGVLRWPLHYGCTT